MLEKSSVFTKHDEQDEFMEKVKSALVSLLTSKDGKPPELELCVEFEEHYSSARQHPLGYENVHYKYDTEIRAILKLNGIEISRSKVPYYIADHEHNQYMAFDAYN